MATGRQTKTPTKNDGEGTMFVFLHKALTTINALALPKKFPKLKSVCEETIDHIKYKREFLLKTEKERAHSQVDQVASMDVEKLDEVAGAIVPALVLACETKQPRILETAIDCLHKLMMYGYIRGEAEEPESGRKIMALIVEALNTYYDFPEESVQLQILKSLLTAVASNVCDIHKTTLMLAIRTCYNISLTTKYQIALATAKGTLGQMLNIVFQRLEKPPPNPVGSKDSAEDRQKLAATDCFVIFRALCILSNKDLTAGQYGPDSIEMKSKQLSLSLLLSVLEEAGPVFRTSEALANRANKKYLCPSICTNGTSSVPVVFKLSLSIFLTLISHFKTHLKEEMGICFTLIFLRILKSGNSTIQQKGMVLQVLLKICRNPQTLVDMFVNYDCSLAYDDIYKRMVEDVSNIAKGTASANASNATQELAIKTLGLECLVTIVKSMVEWTKDLWKQGDGSNPLPDIDIDDPNHTGAITPGDHSDDHHDLNSTPVTNGKEAHHTEGQNGETPENNGNNMYETPVKRGHNKKSSQAGLSTDVELTPNMALEKKKKIKETIDTGVSKFNRGDKKWKDYLVERHILEDKPEAVAKFFMEYNHLLDKEHLGDFIGKPEPFNQATLHAFVELCDFSGQHIDIAIRNFLLLFLLPKIAQRIDAMLLEFGSRYIQCNPDTVFANADAAYVFAFSIVVLATDLHSPAIDPSRKMTLDQWKAVNKGQNDGGDIPDAYQHEVYARIAAKPFAMPGSGVDGAQIELGASVAAPSLTSGLTGSLNPKQKELKWIFESRQMATRVQTMLTQKRKLNAVYIHTTDVTPVRSMFEESWGAILAAFSFLLQSSDDTKIVQMCLLGFKCGIRVSSLFDMEHVRGTFVNSLAQFTNLSNINEIKPKNIESIKTLMIIAKSEGDYLSISWREVLQCISKLELLHLIGKANSSALEPDPTTGYSPSSGAGLSLSVPNSSSPVGATGAAGMPRRPRDQFTDINTSKIVKEIEEIAIDKIFVSSMKLSSNAIVEFVECLCEVALEEIKSDPPRMFSLQKIVEIAYYNMDRIRIVWTRIWAILGPFFVRVGRNENQIVFTNAIDSLRQLATKFLEKEELKNYHFQKDFLKPFELIMTKNPNVDSRELIINCVKDIVTRMYKNIKSGWKSIFAVYAISAADTNEGILNGGFQMMEKIKSDYFELIIGPEDEERPSVVPEGGVENKLNFFVEFVNCWVAFGRNKISSQISMKALDNLLFCTNALISGKIKKRLYVSNNSNSSSSSSSASNNNPQIDIEFWFPVLTGFSEIISHPNYVVRTQALEILFKTIFANYGRYFSQQVWNLVFRGVILPIFIGVRVGAGEVAPVMIEREWIVATCESAVEKLVDLWQQYYDEIWFLMDEILCLLNSFILQPHQANLSQIGCEGLKRMLRNARGWKPIMWNNAVVIMLEYLLQKTFPREVFEYDPKSGFTPSPSPLSISSTTHLISSTNPPSTSSNSSSSSNTANNNHTKRWDISVLARPENNHLNNFSTDSSSSDPNRNNNNNNSNSSNNNTDTVDVELLDERFEVDAFKHKLLRSTPAETRFSFDIATNKCRVHLELISIVSSLFLSHFQHVTSDSRSLLLASILSSYRSSHQANNDLTIRQSLGPTQPDVMNLVIEIEVESMMCYLNVVFGRGGGGVEEKEWMGIVEEVLEDYEKTGLHSASNYSGRKVPIVVCILGNVLGWEDEKFYRHLNRLYEHFTVLMLGDCREIRQALPPIFLRVAKMYFLKN
eukprot:TRINITY_DN3564_c0_g1_i1.p1 TRINITY_DN3564_c0_g1~~TRINITY_DN3564_c0_g1_i1.p1  ORF type:complete len:1744 (-),score=398.50 TRINITY_DN3564_c0_g1_i1:89-5320(-)